MLKPNEFVIEVSNDKLSFSIKPKKVADTKCQALLAIVIETGMLNVDKNRIKKIIETPYIEGEDGN